MYLELKKNSRLKTTIKGNLRKKATYIKLQNNPDLLAEIENYVGNFLAELEATLGDSKKLKTDRNKFLAWLSLSGYEYPDCCRNCRLETFCDWWIMKEHAEKKHYTKYGTPLPTMGISFPNNKALSKKDTHCTMYEIDEQKIKERRKRNAERKKCKE